MKLAASKAIETAVSVPTREKIIPSVFEAGLAERVADAILACSYEVSS